MNNTSIEGVRTDYFVRRTRTMLVKVAEKMAEKMKTKRVEISKLIRLTAKSRLQVERSRSRLRVSRLMRELRRLQIWKSRSAISYINQTLQPYDTLCRV